MTHLRLARLLGALFTLALTLPALGPVPASAAGSGKPPHRAPAAGQPITVSLTASPAANSPGASTRLTATASMDVGPTPFFIEIFDLKFGVNVAICGDPDDLEIPSELSDFQREVVAALAAGITQNGLNPHATVANWNDEQQSEADVRAALLAAAQRAEAGT